MRFDPSDANPFHCTQNGSRYKSGLSPQCTILDIAKPTTEINKAQTEAVWSDITNPHLT
jgi:hypothetical protein